jgi:hypothetical protein
MPRIEEESIVRNNVEINLLPEDLERGKRLVEGLVALKEGARELGIHSIQEENFAFNKGVLMVVQPSKPIDRKLISYKYHKGQEVMRTDTTLDPIFGIHD